MKRALLSMFVAAGCLAACSSDATSTPSSSTAVAASTVPPPGTLEDGSPAPTSLPPTVAQDLCGSVQAVAYQFEALLDPGLDSKAELLGLFDRLQEQAARIASTLPEQLASPMELLSAKLSQVVVDLKASFESTPGASASPKLRADLAKKKVAGLLADAEVTAARKTLSAFITDVCAAPEP